MNRFRYVMNMFLLKLQVAPCSQCRRKFARSLLISFYPKYYVLYVFLNRKESLKVIGHEIASIVDDKENAIDN